VAKKKKKKAKRRKKASRGGAAVADKDLKIQQQYYVTQDLISDIEALRAEKEKALRDELGPHVSLTTSQFVGSVLHDLVKKARKKVGAK
jgi:hypothetical protein